MKKSITALAKKVVDILPAWEFPFDSKAQSCKAIELDLSSGNSEYILNIIEQVKDYPQATADFLTPLKSLIKN